MRIRSLKYASSFFSKNENDVKLPVASAVYTYIHIRKHLKSYPFILSVLIHVCLYQSQHMHDEFEIDLDGCSLTKGCFRRPIGCRKDECHMAITWKPREEDKDYIEFEMQAYVDGWFALGFSEDMKMVIKYLIYGIFSN